MARYATLLYYPADQYWTTPGQIEMSGEYAEFGKAAADVIRGGAALHGVETATTITVAGGPGGDVVTTDGPYAEAKEVLGGFYLLEADDLDEAVRWAAQIPAAWRGRVEVRPVFEMEAPPA
jgi:hypothetical protein